MALRLCNKLICLFDGLLDVDEVLFKVIEGNLLLGCGLETLAVAISLNPRAFHIIHISLTLVLTNPFQEVCVLLRELFVPCPESLQLLLSQEDTGVALLHAFGEVVNLALGFPNELLHRR